MYHNESENTVKSIASITDLFGRSVPVGKNGKVLSERATLVKYFVDHAEDRKGKMNPGRVGFMLAHCSVPDLYAFKSILESEIARPWPQEAGPCPPQSVRWNRIFWARLRTDK